MVGFLSTLNAIGQFLFKTFIGRIIIGAIALLTTLGVLSNHYTNKEREKWRTAVHTRQIILDERYRRIQSLTNAAERSNLAGLRVLSGRYDAAKESLTTALPPDIVSSNVVDLINEGRGIPTAYGESN